MTVVKKSTVQKWMFTGTILALFTLAFSSATDTVSSPGKTGPAVPRVDSLKSPVPSATDTVSQRKAPAPLLQKADSLKLAVPDSAAAKPVFPREPEKLKLVKRVHNGRQQVILATATMIFVIAIMTAAQQWNPK